MLTFKIMLHEFSTMTKKTVILKLQTHFRGYILMETSPNYLTHFDWSHDMLPKR
jgi:hypothetical protein